MADSPNLPLPDDTICLQCGDRGYPNAFVFCIECLEFAVHRYCLDVIPETFDEFVRWTCDDCKDKVHNSEKTNDDGKMHEPGLPVIDNIWKGCFKICNQDYDIFDDLGLVAHISTKACEKVYKEANSFPSMLQLEMLPKSVVWPKSFLTSEPSDENIALYFFPADTKCESKFDSLVEIMMREEVAMKAVLKNAELLIFTSEELPLLYWRFKGKHYLWGVFRGRKLSSTLIPLACPVGDGEVV